MGKLLTRQQVEEITGLSRDSIYRLMRLGEFPKPIRIGIKAVRWPERELETWIDSRPRATGDGPHAGGEAERVA